MEEQEVRVDPAGSRAIPPEADSEAVSEPQVAQETKPHSPRSLLASLPAQLPLASFQKKDIAMDETSQDGAAEAQTIEDEADASSAAEESSMSGDDGESQALSQTRPEKANSEEEAGEEEDEDEPAVDTNDTGDESKEPSEEPAASEDENRAKRSKTSTEADDDIQEADINETSSEGESDSSTPDAHVEPGEYLSADKGNNSSTLALNLNKNGANASSSRNLLPSPVAGRQGVSGGFSTEAANVEANDTTDNSNAQEAATWPRIGSEYQATITEFLGYDAPRPKPEYEVVPFDEKGVPLCKTILECGPTPSREWKESDCALFDKAMFRYSTDFHHVAKDLSKATKSNISVKQCVQYFYDDWPHKSKAYNTWKKQDTTEWEKMAHKHEGTRLSLEERKKIKLQRAAAIAAADAGRSTSPNGHVPIANRKRRRGANGKKDKGSDDEESRANRGDSAERGSPEIVLESWDDPSCEYVPARPQSDIRTWDEEFSDKEQWCVCLGVSQGCMVECTGCKRWFHAACMGLRKDMLDDESFFRCTKCSVKAPKVGLVGPELEKPVLGWNIKHGRGEARRITIIPMEKMRGVKASGDASEPDRPSDFGRAGGGQMEPSKLKVDQPICLRLAPSESREYALVLATRRVPIWDHENRQLIAGAKAPRVADLETYLDANKKMRPFHGMIKRNPRSNLLGGVPDQSASKKEETGEGDKSSPSGKDKSGSKREGGSSAPQLSKKDKASKGASKVEAKVSRKDQNRPSSPSNQSTMSLQQQQLEYQRQMELLRQQQLLAGGINPAMLQFMQQQQAQAKPSFVEAFQSLQEQTKAAEDYIMQLQQHHQRAISMKRAELTQELQALGQKYEMLLQQKGQDAIEVQQAYRAYVQAQQQAVLDIQLLEQNNLNLERAAHQQLMTHITVMQQQLLATYPEALPIIMTMQQLQQILVQLAATREPQQQAVLLQHQQQLQLQIQMLLQQATPQQQQHQPQQQQQQQQQPARQTPSSTAAPVAQPRSNALPGTKSPQIPSAFQPPATSSGASEAAGMSTNSDAASVTEKNELIKKSDDVEETKVEKMSQASETNGAGDERSERQAEHTEGAKAQSVTADKVSQSASEASGATVGESAASPDSKPAAEAPAQTSSDQPPNTTNIDLTKDDNESAASAAQRVPSTSSAAVDSPKPVVATKQVSKEAPVVRNSPKVPVAGPSAQHQQQQNGDQAEQARITAAAQQQQQQLLQRQAQQLMQIQQQQQHAQQLQEQQAAQQQAHLAHAKQQAQLEEQEALQMMQAHQFHQAQFQQQQQQQQLLQQAALQQAAAQQQQQQLMQSQIMQAQAQQMMAAQQQQQQRQAQAAAAQQSQLLQQQAQQLQQQQLQLLQNQQQGGGAFPPEVQQLHLQYVQAMDSLMYQQRLLEQAYESMVKQLQDQPQRLKELENEYQEQMNVLMFNFYALHNQFSGLVGHSPDQVQQLMQLQSGAMPGYAMMSQGAQAATAQQQMNAAQALQRAQSGGSVQGAATSSAVPPGLQALMQAQAMVPGMSGQQMGAANGLSGIPGAFPGMMPPPPPPNNVQTE